MKLVRYDAACRAIAEAKQVDEVLHIHDEARAQEAYAKIAKNKALEADAVVIRVRAVRRLGEMMKEQPKAKGGGPGRGKTGLRATPSFSAPITLKEAGIDKHLAQQARVAAALTPKQFEAHVEDIRKKVVSAAAQVIAAAARLAQRQAAYRAKASDGGTVADLVALVESGQRFGVIYADPPWTFEVYSGKGKARSAENHYDTMKLADIEALPVGALAAENCALFLWGVWPELPGALEVIKSWGFTYKTAAFVWVKQNRSGEGTFTGMGYWTRANSEPCLLATRGAPLRLNADVHQIIHAPVLKHSEKPREARTRIMRLVPGPYFELFARTTAPGWTAWGNEISRA